MNKFLKLLISLGTIMIFSLTFSIHSQASPKQPDAHQDLELMYPAVHWNRSRLSNRVKHIVNHQKEIQFKPLREAGLHEFTGPLHGNISKNQLHHGTTQLKKGHLYYYPDQNVLVIPNQDNSIAPYKDYEVGKIPSITKFNLQNLDGIKLNQR
ncbi:hypothetical protein [Fructilactobacillus carniphilus]|uniref:Uncharacterized protein n=1 Tax=Fructilactobacillus carniphilus TaxID=2940297 RepID=A0ABY5BXY1_9LACO|nr:hypothetical protein [Fructilactobacillus carniphilus]USS90493.1 hypothetical protein M3M37_06545 [Fructilactobacillus carniphilus]